MWTSLELDMVDEYIFFSSIKEIVLKEIVSVRRFTVLTVAIFLNLGYSMIILGTQ